MPLQINDSSDIAPNSSHEQQNQGSSKLDNIPTEIILSIVRALFEDGDDLNGYTTPTKSYEPIFAEQKNVIHLGQACKRLYEITRPEVFKRDIRCHYSSALLISARGGNLDALALSLSYGADVNAPDRSMLDAKRFSCRRPFWRCPTTSSLTALHWAAFCKNDGLVEFLLGHGADVHKRAKLARRVISTLDSDDPLRTESLSWCNAQRGMFCHTQHEYNSNGPGRVLSFWGSRFQGANPLFFALNTAHYPDFPDKGTLPVVNFQNRAYPPRSSIARFDGPGCRLAVAKRLINAGSSLITREKDGIHAIHQACAVRDLEVVQFLLNDMEVDPNTACNAGNTALHVMAMDIGIVPKSPARTSQDMEQSIIKFLIKKGANVQLQNNSGVTAEHMGLVIPDETTEQKTDNKGLQKLENGGLKRKRSRQWESA